MLAYAWREDRDIKDWVQHQFMLIGPYWRRKAGGAVLAPGYAALCGTYSQGEGSPARTVEGKTHRCGTCLPEEEE